MRTDQYIGFNKAAEAFMDSHKISVKVTTRKDYPNGKRITEETTERVLLDKVEYSSYEGMFGEKYPLYCYHHGDARYEEYVQAEPWSSGPCFFLALKKDGIPIPETLWSQKEIDGA